MSQKNTFFFVNFYLYIANFELFPKKSVFWSHLYVGLIEAKVKAKLATDVICNER